MAEGGESKQIEFKKVLFGDESTECICSSLVPRPLPPFQCCTQKRERAWYQMSRDK